MKPILAPIKSGDTGPQVSNLHEALLLLIDRQAIQSFPSPNHPTPDELSTLRARTQDERKEQLFATATKTVVQYFQIQRDLGDALQGVVEEKTAAKLNEILASLGAFDTTDVPFVVCGAVRDGAGVPLAAIRVRAFHDEDGSTARLGEDTTDSEGSYTIRYTPLAGIGVIHLQVAAFDAAGKRLQASNVIHDAKALERVDVTIQADISKPYRVAGKVASRSSTATGGLRVEIVDRNIGGDARLAEAVTDGGGRYEAGFTLSDLRKRGKQLPDLQARVVVGQKLLGASEVRYNASPRETLNVLLATEANASLPSEYDVLTGDLTTHCKVRLGDLKETDDQPDITYLAKKTGWDARAVALAALADQFSAKTKDAAGHVTIEAAFFYALFRAGVPASENGLYRIDAGTVEAIWRKAIDGSVISVALADRIPEATERFRSLVAVHVLEAPAVIGVSSFKELWSLSLGDDDARLNKFAELHARHGARPSEFWKAAETEFGEPLAKRAKLDGQLAYLTRNNAPLIRKLHETAGPDGLGDPRGLVRQGFYRAEKWQDILGDGAVPAEIPGRDTEEKRRRYARSMAAQLRLSYPTSVVAQMVRNGETKLGGHAGPEGVNAFFAAHEDKFDIGRQPVEQYVKRNKLDVPPAVINEVTRIQRVYQITQSDDAMNALLAEDLDSAYQIVRYRREEFVQRFKEVLGGERQARLTYAKAEEVHNAVLNIATTYLTAKVAPGIGVHSDPHNVDNTPRPPAHADDVIAYSTLETLFGEMDYCDCQHCRSVLSPAAYLVDLLHFCDRETNDRENPLSVLLERRPDIEHLPLTCENTNTPVPYIDLVNETLEYFVVNEVNDQHTLANYTGHDTDVEARPEELLASPQFVNDEAYTILKEEFFPPPLPFHQPLENLRRYCRRFETSLAEVMEVLRSHDGLERADAAGYGWSDVLMEGLHLSRAEHRLLTDRHLSLQQVYGFPQGTDVLAELSHVQAFTRRVGITYQDIVDILRTRFINPHAALIPKVERLHVSFARLKALRDSQLEGQAWLNLLLLPEPLLDAGHYGGNIETWVKHATNYRNIMGLVTLATPMLIWARSAAYRRGDCVVPTAPPEESPYYFECTTPGTSADTEPDPWPAMSGATLADGTVVWTCRTGATDCSFDRFRFRYADPDRSAETVHPSVFFRLIRFIRLWRKLGWTIEQTDAAIAALYPAGQMPTREANDEALLEKLDDGFRVLLLRLGVLKRVMDTLGLEPKRDLLSLLACFAPIDTHGPNSLYRQMFTPALQRQASAFADNGYGEFLANDELLSDHEEPLRAAFRLTGEEFAAISDALHYDDGTPLTHTPSDEDLEQLLGHAPSDEERSTISSLRRAENISRVFRRGWLARTLKLSVRELLLLVQVTGIDPFASPDPPTDIDPFAPPDVLHSPIERLIAFVNRLRETGLKPHQALYLVWNQDISGASVPGEEAITQFTRSLRAGFNAIENDLAVADDPDGSIVRSRMTLVYGNEATDLFFGLLNNTLVTEVPYSHARASLEPEILDAAAPGRIEYDDFRKQLRFVGFLDESVFDALNAAAATLATQEAIDAFTAAVDDIAAQQRLVTGPLFARHPELSEAYDVYVASPPPVENKRSKVLATLLPELKRLRKRQHALQAIAEAAGTDAGSAVALLDDHKVLHAAQDDERPALDDLIACEQPGLSAEFFFRDTASGEAGLSRDAEAVLDYSASPEDSPENPLPHDRHHPAGAVSGVWTGYVEAPESGFYNIRIDADVGAVVTLTLDGEPVARQQEQQESLWRNAVPIDWRAGTLHAIRLQVENVTETLRVQWQTTARGWEVIPPRFLYSETLTEHLAAAYVRFFKAASLAAALKLTGNEIAHFADPAAYGFVGQGGLNSLPVKGSADIDTSKALLRALNALLDYARIKAALSHNDERLLAALKGPDARTESDESLLLTLTHWEDASLDDLLIRFGHTGEHSGAPDRSALQDLNLFSRIDRACRLLKKLGITASALSRAATNDPGPATIRELQSSLRARYEDKDWLSVQRPINDEMRGLQRDALVAYALQRMRSSPDSAHIDTADKLFEYFLMDVQMEPCMQTSRVRHALSSVQLFIERCLMALERRVAPSSIDATQWEWMKRYRVWEVVRKISLWPENWLDSELRDDQSPFFKEAMSELLQGDITEERAAVVLGNYLSKLDEVAKLEPCGMFYEEPTGDEENGVVHVVARTPGANRKYYYRRREPSGWMPWEEIKLDIQDRPVIPVVWNNRLFLFWLKILKQAPLDGQIPPNPEPPENTDHEPLPLAECTPQQLKDDAQATAQESRVNLQAVLCWSEFYNGRWQPTRTSGVTVPAELDKLTSTEAQVFDPSILDLGCDPKSEDGTLLTYVTTGGIAMATFQLYNSHSLPAHTRTQSPPYRSPELKRTGDHLRRTDYMGDEIQSHDVLTSSMPFTVVRPLHPLRHYQDAPFLFENSHHVFYVTPMSHPAPIPDWTTPGIMVHRVEEIPQLLVKEDARLTAGQDEFRREPPIEQRWGDRVQVERFVFEDAYITRGIGATGAVRYGDRNIGPAGALKGARGRYLQEDD